MCALLPGPAWAVGVNPGFETGDFTGWTVTLPPDGDAYAKVLAVFPYNNAQGTITNYYSTEGQDFALVKTDGPEHFTTVSQAFTVAAGATLTFDWFFAAMDYLPYNDCAKYQIWRGPTCTEIPLASVSTVGNHGQTGWRTEGYTFLTGGLVTFVFGVANGGDNSQDSFAGLDNVRILAPEPIIPEPLTVLGVLAGIGGLGGYFRRRRVAVTARREP
jgi:hypothetical protein